MSIPTGGVRSVVQGNAAESNFASKEKDSLHSRVPLMCSIGSHCCPCGNSSAHRATPTSLPKPGFSSAHRPNAYTRSYVVSFLTSHRCPESWDREIKTIDEKGSAS